MIGNFAQWLEGVRPLKNSYSLRKALETTIDRLSSQPLTSAGLVIHGAASALAKTGAADFYACVNGTLVLIAAGTDMPALTGCNAATGAFNVAFFYIDSNAVVTMLTGTSGATLGAVKCPEPPKNKALVGFLIITNAGGAFTGGTTALDTATTVYVSPLAGFDPTALTG